MYFLTEQPPESGRYLKTILVYVLCTVAADGFGIMLGTLVNPVVIKIAGIFRYKKFNIFKFIEWHILWSDFIVLHDRFLRFPRAF